MKPSRRALAWSCLAFAVALGGGCTSTDDPRPSPARARGPEHVTVSRELLHAFRDEVYAHYDLRLVADPSGAARERPQLERDLGLARKNEEQARGRLVAALTAAGSEEAGAAGRSGLRELIPILRDALVRTGRFAFIVADPEGDQASFSVVRLVSGPQERAIALFGERFVYQLSVHDETVVEDFPTYRARKLAPPGAPPVIRPAVTVGRSIFVDLAAAQRLGRDSFIPRVEHYRDIARSAADDRAFLAQSRSPAALLGLVKDLLRWRSLEGDWSTWSALPLEEQVTRFAENYVDREIVRAAAEAQELEKARLAGDPRPSPERLLPIERRAMLSAIVHGEPLGETATTIGLAAARAGMDRPAPDPNAEAVLRAAIDVTLALVNQLDGKPGAALPGGPAPERTPDEEARVLARLARATPDELRAAAAAVWRRLPPPAPPAPRPG